MRIGVVLLLTAVLAYGCANAAPFRGMPASGADRFQLVLIPPVAQSEDYSCGFAALRSVALYHADADWMPDPRDAAGEDLSAVQIKKLAIDGGLEAYMFQGSLEILKENLAKGRPMLCLLGNPPRTGSFPGFEWARDTLRSLGTHRHWVVVTGFVPRKRLVLHDPARGRLAMNEDDFVSLWERTARVCVLIAPRVKPDTTP